MKTYAFQVVLEKEKAVWRAYIPALEHKGAASWGYTEKEALKNLQDAVNLLVESLLEHGEQHLLKSIVQHEKKLLNPIHTFRSAMYL